MKHLAPACFRAFACAAGSCPDSCCRAGWEIVPDEKTLALYQKLPGAAGARIRAGIIPGDEPLLRQDQSRVCVLLDPDGLCCVQKHFGHGALCRVCREYPRFHREFGGLTEHGLSLSCPTAYALATAAPPAWEEWEDDAPPVPNELDPEAYLRLRKGRDLALELLAREDLPLWRRIALVRRLAAVLQGAPERIVHHDYSTRLRRWSFRRVRSCPAQKAGTIAPIARRAIPDLTARRSSLLRLRRSGAIVPLRGHDRTLRSLARRFLTLEILSPAWKDALERFAAMAEAGALPEDAPLRFGTRTAEYRPYMEETASEEYARWLWYALYKYWLDALDDGDLLGRVDRALDMLRLGMAMDRAFPEEGPFLRRISREIEHCEENLTALLSNSANSNPQGGLM